MEQQSGGRTGFAARGSAGGDYGPAAERLSEAIGDLDRRYGLSQTIRDHPWPALAVAAGVGFALAETSLDRGARSATAEATTGVRTGFGSLVDAFASAATATVTQALHGHLESLVAELKQAIGAPTVTR